MFPRKLKKRALSFALFGLLMLIYSLSTNNSETSPQYDSRREVLQRTAKSKHQSEQRQQQQQQQQKCENCKDSLQQTHSSIKTLSQPTCQPKKSFVFIKIHKSGSTTLIAPMQKFAYRHNLSAVVPLLDDNNALGWPFKFMPERNIVMPPAGRKFQALVNHVVYNRTVMDQIMEPQTVYITLIRDPKQHLLSSYTYFGLNKDNKIGEDPKAYEMFLNDSKRYDSLPNYFIGLNASRTHVKSLTRNLQSADLGFEYRDFDNNDAIQRLVRQIEREFAFIIVLERLSESLVLMKRRLCWSMQDILHVYKNRWGQSWGYENINLESAQRAYTWSKVDTLIYDMAQRKLNDARKGQEKLEEEIALFENIQKNITDFCANMKKWNTTNLYDPEPLVIEKSEFNEEFLVNRQCCVPLLLHENHLTLIFKCRQFPNHRQCKENINFLHELYSLIHGVHV